MAYRRCKDMTLKPQQVRLDDGRTVEVYDLVAEVPKMFVFLRHLGCVFCRRQIGLLREVPAESVVFVGMADCSDARELLAKLKSPHRMICDPEKRLYAEFQLESGGMRELFNRKVLTQGFAAIRAGYMNGRPMGDPWQLAGAFVIQPDGDVSWSMRSQDASEMVTPSLVAEALRNDPAEV